MSGAVQNLFTNRTLRRFLGQTRYLLALALVVPLARYMRPPLLPAGVAISLFGQLIQGWCFASLVKNLELSIRGPYMLVRNPMYLGRYFMILGFVVLLDSWIAIGVYTVLYYPYMHYRVKGEEGRLRREYGEQFDAYCRDVGRFFPSLRKIGDPAVRFFDWKMFLSNNGHWNILLTLLAFAAIQTIHRLWFT
jgi:hypothetical protein